MNFSVPIGLRQARAGLRQWELILRATTRTWSKVSIARITNFATVYRDLSRSYEQFLALKRTRESALPACNVKAAAQTGSVIYIVALQALTDWGMRRLPNRRLLHNTTLHLLAWSLKPERFLRATVFASPRNVTVRSVRSESISARSVIRWRYHRRERDSPSCRRKRCL